MYKIASKGSILVGVMALASVGVSGEALASYGYGTNAASNTVVAAESSKTAATASAGQVGGRVSSALSAALGGIGAPTPTFAPAPAPTFAPAPAPAPGAPTTGPGGGGGAPGGPGGGGGGGTGQPGDQTQLLILGLGDGRAAGADPRRMGVWMNVGNTWMDKDDPGTGADFDGTVTTVMGGVDYRVTDKILAGLALGYEAQDIDTPFNLGGLEADGFTIAPYVGVSFTDRISADVTLGTTLLGFDANRQNGTITGETDGTRYFGAANLNAVLFQTGGFTLGSTLGYMYVRENQDRYTETNGTAVEEVRVRLGQIRGSLKGSYLARTSFGYVNPYLSARMEYDHVNGAATYLADVNDWTANDDLGAVFGLGVNVGLGDNLTLSLLGETTEFRDNLDVYSLSGTVRYQLKF